MRYGIYAGLLFGLTAGVTGCSSPNEGNIVIATESAITIETSRLDDPIAVARAHCAKYGREVLSRGGVKVGEPAYRIMWGYDCVKPGTK